MKNKTGFLNELFKDLKPYVSKKHPNSIFYIDSNDNVYLQRKEVGHGWLWVSNQLVWSILENKYLLNHSEISDIIKSLVFKNLNFIPLNPNPCDFYDPSGLEEPIIDIKMDRKKRK